MGVSMAGMDCGLIYGMCLHESSGWFLNPTNFMVTSTLSQHQFLESMGGWFNRTIEKNGGENFCGTKKISGNRWKNLQGPQAVANYLLFQNLLKMNVLSEILGRLANQPFRHLFARLSPILGAKILGPNRNPIWMSTYMAHQTYHVDIFFWWNLQFFHPQKSKT